LRRLAALTVFLLGVTPAFAHGVGYRIVDGAVALSFYYSTGDAMAWMEAEVFSPNDAEFPFQTGRTDAEGCFAFVPNTPGLWRVAVKDNQGHMAEAEVGVEQGGVYTMESVGSPMGAALYLRAALGVSLIFNAAAVLLIIRRRKANCT
jgi:nickel transport protein